MYIQLYNILYKIYKLFAIGGFVRFSMTFYLDVGVN